MQFYILVHFCAFGMALQFNNEEMSVEQKLALLEAKYAFLEAEKTALEHANAKLIEKNEAEQNEAELNKKLSEMEILSLKDKNLIFLKSLALREAECKESKSAFSVARTDLFTTLIELSVAQSKLNRTQHAYTAIAENFADLQAEHDTLKAEHDELATTLNFVLNSRN